MVVVDAVEIVVLVVPAERREQHTHVQPRHVHTVDGGLGVRREGERREGREGKQIRK